jgi:hypothetical protein
VSIQRVNFGPLLPLVRNASNDRSQPQLDIQYSGKSLRQFMQVARIADLR